MSMNTTTKAITLPDDHWAYIEAHAAQYGLTLEQALKHAIRVMQAVESKQRTRLDEPCLAPDSAPWSPR